MITIMTKEQRREFHRLAYYQKMGWAHDEEKFAYLLSLWREEQAARDALDSWEETARESERQYEEYQALLRTYP